GFLEFLTEGEEILRALRSGNLHLPEARRLVHTLKGNAAIFGLGQVAGACHGIEEAMGERGDLPLPAEVTAVCALWEGVRSRLKALLGEDLCHRIELDDAEYVEI